VWAVFLVLLSTSEKSKLSALRLRYSQSALGAFDRQRLLQLSVNNKYSEALGGHWSTGMEGEGQRFLFLNNYYPEGGSAKFLGSEFQ